jgi:hypothetical protein
MRIASDSHIKLPEDGRSSVQAFEFAGKLIVANKGFENVRTFRVKEIAGHVFAREQGFSDESRCLESFCQKVGA